MPLKISEVQHPVTVGSLTVSRVIDQIPGVGTASLYTAGDAVGTKFQIPNVFRYPGAGVTLHTALFLDRDDEGVAMELVLFNADFTATADNTALSISDEDISNLVGIVSWATTDFVNYAANQVGFKVGLGLLINGGPTPHLYGQFMTRGGPTIAAANIPGVRLVFLQD